MTGPGRVLLIDPSDECLGRTPGGGKPAPLLGLTCVASRLGEAGFTVKALDRTVRSESLRSVALDFQPDIIGLTSATPFFHAAAATARELKALLPDALLVLGGPHASSAAGPSLAACPELDAVAVGEGEETMVELAEAVMRGDRRLAIDGLLLRDDPQSFRPRRLIRDLDSLTFPDWSLFDYRDYERIYSRRLGEALPVFQVQASRGCPNQCSFCYNIFGPSWRLRSPKRVAAEVFHDYVRHGARHFEFVDPVMPFGRKWFGDFCRALEAGPTHGRIAWGFETRTDCANEELFRAAARVGCERVLLGLESGSQAMLDRMGKRCELGDSWSAVEAAVRAGLKVQATILVGHPGETHESLDLTVDMVRAMRAEFDVQFFPAFLAVYPDTDVRISMDRGQLDARWVDDQAREWRSARRDRPALETGDLTARDLTNFMRDLRNELNTCAALQPIIRTSVRP